MMRTSARGRIIFSLRQYDKVDALALGLALVRPSLRVIGCFEEPVMDMSKRLCRPHAKMSDDITDVFQ
jgi:hypothetical protein